MRSFFARLLTTCLFVCPAAAQMIRSAKPSTLARGDLTRRYNDLRCALVLIRTQTEFGTGFFVNRDGDIATASHVLGQRAFTSEPNGKMKADLVLPSSFTIIDSAGKSTDVPATKVERNGDAWGADVALLKSGIHTNCWLKTAGKDLSSPGEHVITMGFPGLSWGSLAIYTGIMSARLKLDLILGFTNTGEPVKPENEFIRVQMPISTGLSGAPIIDDGNTVIGIVTMAGASTRDIDVLIQLNHLNAFAAVPPAVAPPAQQGAPPQVTVNLNAFSILAQLAESLRNFASPGYGDAVPIRYLRKEPRDSQKPSSHAH